MITVYVDFSLTTYFYYYYSSLFSSSYELIVHTWAAGSTKRFIEHVADDYQFVDCWICHSHIQGIPTPPIPYFHHFQTLVGTYWIATTLDEVVTVACLNCFEKRLKGAQNYLPKASVCMLIPLLHLCSHSSPLSPSRFPLIHFSVSLALIPPHILLFSYILSSAAIYPLLRPFLCSFEIDMKKFIGAIPTSFSDRTILIFDTNYLLLAAISEPNRSLNKIFFLLVLSLLCC